MVSLQPEAMTMEAFQMNGGTTQYEPYEADNNPTVMAVQGGGPGSFPELIGTDGQEYGYNGTGNGGYSPAESTSSHNDGDDFTTANINFVFANEKRFSDFHSVFRSVPDEEKLIEGNCTYMAHSTHPTSPQVPVPSVDRLKSSTNCSVSNSTLAREDQNRGEWSFVFSVSIMPERKKKRSDRDSHGVCIWMLCGKRVDKKKERERERERERHYERTWLLCRPSQLCVN
jgi:hypothetical protein